MTDEKTTRKTKTEPPADSSGNGAGELPTAVAAQPDEPEFDNRPGEYGGIESAASLQRQRPVSG